MTPTFATQQKVEVKTFCLCEMWNPAVFQSHKPASPVNGELFFFKGRHGTFVVRAEDIDARVRWLDADIERAALSEVAPCSTF